MLPESYGLLDLTRHNVKHNDVFMNKQIDCFRNKVIEKKITYDRLPTKWDCSDFFELTSSTHFVDKNFFTFHKCVEKAIPKLPKHTTPKEIAEAFNSRYFARNIALAIKYLNNDPRVKASNLFLKRLTKNPTTDVKLIEKVFGMNRNMWPSKDQDVSIAAAAVMKIDTSNQTENKKQERAPFNLKLDNHLKSLEFIFKSFTSQDLSKVTPFHIKI